MHFASSPAYFPPWRLSLTIVLLFLWNKCVLHYDVCCWNCSVIETCLCKKLKTENFTVTQRILLKLQEFNLNQWSSTFFVQLPPCRNIAMKSPPFMISVLSKKLLYFENNRQSSQYKKTNKQNECKCVCRKNIIHFQKQLIPTTANLGSGFLS